MGQAEKTIFGYAILDLIHEKLLCITSNNQTGESSHTPSALDLSLQCLRVAAPDNQGDHEWFGPGRDKKLLGARTKGEGGVRKKCGGLTPEVRCLKMIQ